jgi:hypothetical protein
MQMPEHIMEFYKSKQQQIKIKRDFYKALTDYCNTIAQRQASSTDKIVNFTLNSIFSYRRSSTMGFTSFYGTRRKTSDFLTVSNKICAIYIDDDVTKNPNEHTSIPNRDFVVYPTKRWPGKEIYQDLHSTSRHRVPIILVLFFPFGDKM